jgi:hypothetical protein
VREEVRRREGQVLEEGGGQEGEKRAGGGQED